MKMTEERWASIVHSWNLKRRKIKGDNVTPDYRRRVTIMAFGGRKTHRRLWKTPLIAAITSQIEAGGISV